MATAATGGFEGNLRGTRLVVGYLVLIAFLVGWLPSAVIAVGVAYAVKSIWMALFARPQRFVTPTY